MPDQSVKSHSHLFHLSNQPLIHFSPEIIVYGSISLLFKSVYTSGCISSGYAIKEGSQFPIIIIMSVFPTSPNMFFIHLQVLFSNIFKVTVLFFIIKYIEDRIWSILFNVDLPLL